ncbi:MAG: choice-of-anchor I family protein [Candidatus Competibacteraceae bacterium]|jgi:YVTN family beta-propeller protein|nr:choice-of-anchor I family protein [Candidatus Competibacteraceae bacterium]
MLRVFTASILLSLCAVPVLANDLNIDFLSRITIGGEGAAEISSYDPASQRLFVTNGDTAALDIIDLSNPAMPIEITSIPIATLSGGNPVDGLTSVAVKNGLVAVALAADPEQDPGYVAVLDTNGSLLFSVTVGALPDMVTFTPDGDKILVANEGEPNGSDPDASIGIIDLADDGLSATVALASFSSFNGMEEMLRAEGVRLFPGKTTAQDVEPEYIAISPDGSTAFVTLQEANSLAVVDIASATVTDIVPLGSKDHSLPGNGLDPSDEDGGINIANWPVFGLYMPDAIAAYAVDGETYLVTANEGDARDEDARISDLMLDPTAFPDAATLQVEANLGRLEVSTIDGDTDGDGDYDQLFAYGARSFTIWNSSANVLFDSGDEFAQILATLADTEGNPDLFPDGRSDNKGSEPEGVTVGKVGGRYYAFIGLERANGIMVYDVTDPNAPSFVDYLFNDIDVGPEGVLFIPASDSSTCTALLVVTNEISGTVTTYALYPKGLGGRFGVYRSISRQFYRDSNGNGTWQGNKDLVFGPWGTSGDLSFTGDFNGDCVAEIGTFRSSAQQAYVDTSGDGSWQSNADSVINLAPVAHPGDIPVAGNPFGTGTVLALYRPSTSVFLFADGSATEPFGNPGDRPFMGDFNGDGIDEIGVYRPDGHFLVDLNNDFVWNPAQDAMYGPFGAPQDWPVIADWSGNGSDDIGTYRPASGRLFTDQDGNRVWNVDQDGADGPFGIPGDQPVVFVP